RRRVRARRGPGAAAEHRRDARHQRLFTLLRADEVDVRVDAARRRDAALPGDDLRARPDHDLDPGLHVGIPGLADGEDAAVLDADIRLDDPPEIGRAHV